MVQLSRRAAVRAVGLTSVGFGGCFGRGSTVLGTDQPSTDTRTISLVEQDASALDVSVRAEMLDTQVTSESTALVAVTLTNEGSPREIRAHVGPKCDLFNRSRGGSKPEGLWLHHETVHSRITEDDDRVGERWSYEPRGFLLYGCDGRQYESGEEVTSRYYVWDDDRTEHYMAPGRYRFEAPVVVWEDHIDNRSSFDWGFEVRVEAGD